MERIILSFVVLVLGTSCFAQDLKTVELPRGVQRQSLQIVNGIATHTYTSGNRIPINGNPYLKKEFLPGILELNDGSKSDLVPLRYNIARDEFEVISNGDTLTLNRPYKVKQILYDNKVFIFDPEMREKTERKYNGYFQLCVEGNFSLYIKRNKDLVYDNFVSNYQGGSGTKEYYYVDKVSYVARISGQKGFLLKNSKGSFLKHMDKNKQKIKTFIKENNIKFNNEDDLIKLVRFYNNI